MPDNAPAPAPARDPRLPLRVAKACAAVQAAGAAVLLMLGLLALVLEEHQHNRSPSSSDWHGLAVAFALLFIVTGGVLALLFGVFAARVDVSRPRSVDRLQMVEVLFALMLVALLIRGALTNPIGAVVWLVYAVLTVATSAGLAIGKNRRVGATAVQTGDSSPPRL